MTSSRVRRIPRNREGRDSVVGDVHRCFRTLEPALAEVRFDAGCDRLFGVGDLVDRGSYSAEALVWIERRFEAVVMGNHIMASVVVRSFPIVVFGPWRACAFRPFRVRPPAPRDE